jgi:hypothetical protein
MFMRKLLIASLIVITLVLSFANIVAASPPADKPGNGPPELDKIVFIHYEKGVKPDKPGKPDRPGKPGGNGDPIDYYKLTKLMLPGTTSYLINPSGSGISTLDDAVDAIKASFDIWDSNTLEDLFIYGGETDKSGTIRDNNNTVSWAPISDTRVIAQATMWYMPGKPPRTIVEYDIVFNSLKQWGIDTDGEGATTTISTYDIQNIATHEVGHPVGLDDLLDDKYNMLTMHGYSDVGETNKRSLESGDINGAQSLYGTP